MQFVALNSTRASAPVFNGPGVVWREHAEYAGKPTPTDEHFRSFVFEHTTLVLEGGRQTLRLRKPLTLKIDTEKMRFEVNDWGIEMDCIQLPDLPREVARRFLFLLSASENSSLSVQDQAHLLRISDYVDFRQFSIERSAPRYMEGILRTRSDIVIVEWHDGQSQRDFCYCVFIHRRADEADLARRCSHANCG